MVSHITLGVKKKIERKFNYPVCVEQFYLYEKALRVFCPPIGSIGVKTSMDKNNDKIKYTMEVKILGTGNTDRLVSSGNDGNFDTFIDDGFGH